MLPPALSVSLLRPAGSLAAGASTRTSGRAGCAWGESSPTSKNCLQESHRHYRDPGAHSGGAAAGTVYGGAAGRPRAAGTGRELLAAAGTVKRRRNGQTPTQSTGAGRRNGQTPKKWSNAEEVIKRRHSRQRLAAVAAARRAFVAPTRHGEQTPKWSNTDEWACICGHG